MKKRLIPNEPSDLRLPSEKTKRGRHMDIVAEQDRGDDSHAEELADDRPRTEAGEGERDGENRPSPD